MADSKDQLRIRPLTPDLWPAFEDLFGQGGPCSRCWCMYWRTGPTYRKHPAFANKSAFHLVVQKGPPPGLVALLENQAVGWCQLTPRDALAWLNKAGKFERVDDDPVWSISCFYICKGYRKKGITAALIGAAIEAAKESRVHALESYPLNAALTRSTSFTGYSSTFLRAGFEIVAGRLTAQPIMRLEFRAQSATSTRKTRRGVSTS